MVSKKKENTAYRIFSFTRITEESTTRVKLDMNVNIFVDFDDFNLKMRVLLNKINSFFFGENTNTL